MSHLVHSPISLAGMSKHPSCLCFAFRLSTPSPHILCPSALPSQGGVWGGPGCTPSLDLQLEASGRDAQHQLEGALPWRASTSQNCIWKRNEKRSLKKNFYWESFKKAFLGGGKCTWRGFFHSFFKPCRRNACPEAFKFSTLITFSKEGEYRAESRAKKEKNTPTF